MNFSDTFRFVSAITERPEWDFMWDALVAHWKGDAADYNPAYSECWQYMGSSLHPISFTWEHTFRHRMHPRTNRREYWRIPASPRFNLAHPTPAPKPTPAPANRCPIRRFDPIDCGGTYDGVSTITSDADTGL